MHILIIPDNFWEEDQVAELYHAMNVKPVDGKGLYYPFVKDTLHAIKTGQDIGIIQKKPVLIKLPPQG